MAVLGGHANCVVRILESEIASPAMLKSWATRVKVGSETMIEWAVHNGHSTLVKSLIAKCGVDVNKSYNSSDTDAKHTLLTSAAENGHIHVLDVLINAGVKLDNCTNHGLTALMAAAYHDHFLCVQLLVNAGARLNLSDTFNQTALFKAAWRGNKDCLEFLVDRSADLDYANNDGITPLMASAYCGHVACLELLLQSGAKLDVVNWEGLNALHLAVREDRVECVDLLLCAGATADDHALNVAVSRDHAGCATLLLDDHKYSGKVLENLLNQAQKGAMRKVIQDHLRSRSDLAPNPPEIAMDTESENQEKLPFTEDAAV